MVKIKFPQILQTTRCNMMGVKFSKILQVTSQFKIDWALMAPKQDDVPNILDPRIEVKLILKHVKQSSMILLD